MGAGPEEYSCRQGNQWGQGLRSILVNRATNGAGPEEYSCKQGNQWGRGQGLRDFVSHFASVLTTWIGRASKSARLEVSLTRFNFVLNSVKVMLTVNQPRCSLRYTSAYYYAFVTYIYKITSLTFLFFRRAQKKFFLQNKIKTRHIT